MVRLIVKWSAKKKEPNVYSRLYRTNPRNITSSWVTATKANTRVKQNRRPTPVAHVPKEQFIKTVKPVQSDHFALYESEVEMHNSTIPINFDVPWFASDTPFSDGALDVHPLIELDDYDVDENLLQLISDFKSKTHAFEFMTPAKENMMAQSQKSASLSKRIDTDYGDFEKEETTISPDLLDSRILKKWVMQLTHKLKLANKKIANLKMQMKQESKNLESKLEEAAKYTQKLKCNNSKVNKKLIEAIETMKMSCFNFELTNDDSDYTLQQLRQENKTLRKFLKIQNKFDCKMQVEEILKSEELVLATKEGRVHQYPNVY